MNNNRYTYLGNLSGLSRFDSLDLFNCKRRRLTYADKCTFGSTINGSVVSFKRAEEMRKAPSSTFFRFILHYAGHTYLFSVHRLSIVKRCDCRRIFASDVIPGTFTKSGMACPNVPHIWRVGDRRFHRGERENAPELIYSNFMLINSYVIYCSAHFCVHAGAPQD